MENDSVQRGQKEVPHWGPPAKRAPVSQASSHATIDQASPPPLSDLPPPPLPQNPQPLPPPAPWLQPTPGQPPRPVKPDTTALLSQIGKAPWWLVTSVLVASVLLELALRTRLNSLASLLAALTITTLVISSARRRRPSVAVALGVAVLSAGVAVLRASPWVTVPTLLLAGSCLVVAGQGRLSSGRLWGVIGQYLRDMARSVRWLLLPLRASRGRAFSSFGRSVALAAVAVVPLALLLASADAVFGQLLTSVGPGNSWQHAALTVVILPFVAAIAIAARQPDISTPEGSPMGRGRAAGPALSMTDATVVLGSVGLLLAAWGITQVVVALGGADRLLATANLTAAENARQGFFQLVAATAFLIGIIVAVDRFTQRVSRADRLRFLGFTVLIGLETLGVVVATYSRLALYISGFGNTMLRTSVAWFLAWLAVVMFVLVVSVNRANGTRWFAKVVFGSAAVWILAFGLWNPEAAVARGNLERSEQVTGVDYRYLGQKLGPDAIPTLVELVPTVSAEYRVQLTEDLCRQTNDLGGGYRFFSWNRSHHTATEALGQLGC